MGRKERAGVSGAGWWLSGRVGVRACESARGGMGRGDGGGRWKGEMQRGKGRPKGRDGEGKEEGEEGGLSTPARAAPTRAARPSWARRQHQLSHSSYTTPYQATRRHATPRRQASPSQACKRARIRSSLFYRMKMKSSVSISFSAFCGPKSVTHDLCRSATCAVPIYI